MLCIRTPGIGLACVRTRADVVESLTHLVEVGVMAGIDCVGNGAQIGRHYHNPRDLRFLQQWQERFCHGHDGNTVDLVDCADVSRMTFRREVAVHFGAWLLADCPWPKRCLHY